jgi:hypothetical protein
MLFLDDETFPYDEIELFVGKSGVDVHAVTFEAMTHLAEGYLGPRDLWQRK